MKSATIRESKFYHPWSLLRVWLTRGERGLSCDYADASTPHSLWVVRHFMKAGISPSDPTP